MLNWLKRLIAGKELRALERYRTVCGLTYRWNGQLPNSAETAQWIQLVGEGRLGYDIEGFRSALIAGQGQKYLDQAVERAARNDHLR